MKTGWDTINEPGLLQIGDVMHLRGRSEIIGPGIRLFSTHRGERPTFANHTAHVHQEARYNVLGRLRQGVEIVEAESDGTNVNPLEHYRDRAEIVITRVRQLTREEKDIVQMEGTRYVQYKYPFLKIALHAMQRLIKASGWSIVKLSFSPKPYCTMLTALCLHRVGISLGMDSDIIQPDDALDFAMRQGHEIVWASGEEAIKYLRESYPERFPRDAA